MGAVIGRSAIKFDGKFDCTDVAQLVCVDSRSEPRSDSRAQNLSSLINIEGTAVAEHVNPLRVGGSTGQHFAGNQRNVLIHTGLTAFGKLSRYNVRTQEGGLVGVGGSDSK